ncbi:MAG: hypothetical protein NVS2B16_27780 [Chloroflexota bacterium]
MFSIRPLTILVPYDQSDGARDMLQLACQGATARGGHIIVLAITEVHRGLPLHNLPRFVDERSSNALVHAHEVARQFDVEIESRMCRSYDVAQTIIEQSYETQCDAIFLAVKQPSLYRFLPRLSRRDRLVVFHACCPVLLGHMPSSYALNATGILAEVDRMLSQAP